MYCTQCGSPSNDPAAKTCSMCGAKLMSAMLSGETTDGLGFSGTAGPEPSRVHVPNYLVQSIIVTFFCCLPFGIPAIVYAAQVDEKLRRGDVEGARRASSSAKTWCWVSFGLGLVSTVIFFLISLAAELAQVNQRVR